MRRLLSQSEFMFALAEEVKQIADLMRLINSGGMHHVHGLSARIRSTICYMKNKNDLPLLQYCASLTDVPLTVYMPGISWVNRGNVGAVSIGSRIFSQRMHSDDIELDLDLWLVLDQTVFGDKKISNNGLLRGFSETRGGAHHDKSVDPDIDEYMMCNGLTVGGYGMFNLMTAFILEVGLVICLMGERVAAAFEDCAH